MSNQATVRVMTAEEIAARGSSDVPYLQLPARGTLFAERQMRLRQLASGHPMGDYLLFMADVAAAQQAALQQSPEVALPDRAALDEASRQGLAPLASADWPRDAAWHGVLRELATQLQGVAPEGVRPVLARLATADAGFLEQQADLVLLGVADGLDMACAPLVAAALQVYWSHMLLSLHERDAARGQVFGRPDDETACPCCGSRPTASITRSAGGAFGQRYLQCSLCALQWHLPRIKCAHCLATEQLAYQSLEVADSPDTENASRAAQSALQAETCDACRHYLKIMHTDRDPFVDPVADDLASLTLDLLVSEAGYRRHGVNLAFFFGAPEDAPPPEPGAG